MNEEKDIEALVEALAVRVDTLLAQNYDLHNRLSNALEREQRTLAEYYRMKGVDFTRMA